MSLAGTRCGPHFTITLNAIGAFDAATDKCNGQTILSYIYAYWLLLSKLVLRMHCVSARCVRARAREINRGGTEGDKQHRPTYNKYWNMLHTVHHSAPVLLIAWCNISSSEFKPLPFILRCFHRPPFR